MSLKLWCKLDSSMVQYILGDITIALLNKF